jgi:hypothetical protein
MDVFIIRIPPERAIGFTVVYIFKIRKILKPKVNSRGILYRNQTTTHRGCAG